MIDEVLLMSSTLTDTASAIVEGVVLMLLAGGAEAARRLRNETRDNDRRIADIEDHLELDADPTRLDRHEEQMSQLITTQEQFKRYFEGDDADPSDHGLLQDVHDTKQDASAIKETVEELADERDE